MKRAAVMIIHGMGNQRADYAEGFMNTVRSNLGSAANDLVLQSCWWADILQTSQDDVWKRLQRNTQMTWDDVRAFMISHFGDPPQYLSGFFRTGKPIYSAIHERVRERLEAIEHELADARSAPLMIAAHSLGGAIISNYIWDAQHHQDVGTTAFQRTETLWSLLTYGCNIPLFIPPLRPIECITLPWPSAPPHIKPTAHWLNVFAPADVLGFPMANVWDEPHGTRITDVAVNVGPFPLSRTPLAHTEYEQDREFVRIVCNEITTMLSIPQH